MKGKGIKIHGWVFPRFEIHSYKKPKSRLSHLRGNLWMNFLLKVYCKYEALNKYVLNGTMWTVGMNEATELLKIWSYSENTSILIHLCTPRSTVVHAADYCLLLSVSFLDNKILSIFVFYLYRYGTGRGNYIYCNLNVCVPPKFACWKPNAQCDGFKRCGPLGGEIMRAGPSWMGLMPLKKRPHRAP